MARRKPIPVAIVQYEPAGLPAPGTTEPVAPAPPLAVPPAPSAPSTPASQVVEVREVAREIEASLPAPSTFQLALGLGGALLGAYHGTRRNHGSLLWGLTWGAAGAFAPAITTGVALAQGLGRPKGGR